MLAASIGSRSAARSMAMSAIARRAVRPRLRATAAGRRERIAEVGDFTGARRNVADLARSWPVADRGSAACRPTPAGRATRSMTVGAVRRERDVEREHDQCLRPPRRRLVPRADRPTRATNAVAAGAAPGSPRRRCEGAANHRPRCARERSTTRSTRSPSTSITRARSTSASASSPAVPADRDRRARSRRARAQLRTAQHFRRARSSTRGKRAPSTVCVRLASGSRSTTTVASAARVRAPSSSSAIASKRTLAFARKSSGTKNEPALANGARSAIASAKRVCASCSVSERNRRNAAHSAASVKRPAR